MGATSKGHVDTRSSVEDQPNIDGVTVREDDIEPVKGIRTIAVIFRGTAVLLLVLMALQVFFAFTSAVPLSAGVVIADAVRLIVYAGLLWGAGDLAVLFVKSHYDLRATRILMTRLAYNARPSGATDGDVPPEKGGSRSGRAT